MEKKEANKEPFNRPDGVEVKLTAKSINIRGFLFFFILFLIGSYLFVYVWMNLHPIVPVVYWVPL